MTFGRRANRTGPLPSTVLAGYGFEIIEDGFVCEDAEFEVIACYIEESRIGLQNLFEDGVEELGDAGARDVDEGERCWEEGDGELHGSRTIPRNLVNLYRERLNKYIHGVRSVKAHSVEELLYVGKSTVKCLHYVTGSINEYEGE